MVFLPLNIPPPTSLQSRVSPREKIGFGLSPLSRSCGYDLHRAQPSRHFRYSRVEHQPVRVKVLSFVGGNQGLRRIPVDEIRRRTGVPPDDGVQMSAAGRLPADPPLQSLVPYYRCFQLDHTRSVLPPVHALTQRRHIHREFGIVLENQGRRVGRERSSRRRASEWLRMHAVAPRSRNGSAES